MAVQVTGRDLLNRPQQPSPAGAAALPLTMCRYRRDREERADNAICLRPPTKLHPIHTTFTAWRYMPVLASLGSSWQCVTPHAPAERTGMTDVRWHE
jgi:hypothetical protein